MTTNEIHHKIDCLDHGFVRLVDWMGSDLSIVRAARVSYAAAWRAGEDRHSDRRLIHYLTENNHTTPFESVVFTFEVMAPIYVLRQWHRHRTWCIAGDMPVTFDDPYYKLKISDIVRKWNTDVPRKRETGAISLLDYRRRQLMDMKVRSPCGDAHITDAWFSGEKPVYRLRTRRGEVVTSADHVFKTPEGAIKLADAPKQVMSMISVGERVQCWSPVEFTKAELRKEEWVEFTDGYEISNLGRVRSYWMFGPVKRKRDTPELRQVTMYNGRAVIGWKRSQVSRLVWQSFVGPITGQILHKNDNAADNRLSNLYEGSPLDNAADQYVNGGRVWLRQVPLDVLDITKAGRADTFDLSVTGDHWFCVNNLIVHNSYNELSGRYRELPETFYVPEPEKIGSQDPKNKQGRVTDATKWLLADREMECIEYTAHCQNAFDLYRKLLSKGWPRELARGVLPLATYSHMFATVNLLNLLKFITLRTHSHAQYEVKVYAWAAKQLVQELVPTTIAAWEKNYWYNTQSGVIEHVVSGGASGESQADNQT